MANALQEKAAADQKRAERLAADPPSDLMQGLSETFQRQAQQGHALADLINNATTIEVFS